MKTSTLSIALALGCVAATASVPALAQSRRGLEVRQADGTRKVRLDVVLCVDSTGSMGDEIEVVKKNLSSLVKNIASGTPRPDVRFGLVTFRDRGDAYVVKKWPFSRNISEVDAAIETLQADGGGDGPESVNEALHVSIEEMEWDTTPGVERVVFLIGDAPPHYYADDYSWKNLISSALSRRISINTIGCSGIEDYGSEDNSGSAIAIFQEIAQRTEGRFDYLSYFATMKEGGKSTYVLREGGRTYAVAPAFKSRWREGSRRLTALGGAKPASLYLQAENGQNNLDYVLAQGSQYAVQRRGVRYGQNVSRPLTGRTLARGFDSPIKRGQARVIRSAAEWQTFWKAHNDYLPVPRVNWSREVVAVVVAPHAVRAEVTGAELQNGSTLVSYALVQNSKPVKGNAAYHFVAVPRERGTVVLARAD